MTIQNRQNLLINIFKQGSFYVAYCPVLDLSSCGKTKDKAFKMIEEAIEVFFEEIDKKTNQVKADQVELLTSLGWEVNKSNQLVAPQVYSRNLKFQYA